MQSANCRAQLEHKVTCDTMTHLARKTLPRPDSFWKARQPDWHGRSHSSLGDQLPFLVCRWKGGAAWNVMRSKIPFEKQMCSKALSWTEDLRSCSQSLGDDESFDMSNCCNARFMFALLHPSFRTIYCSSWNMLEPVYHRGIAVAFGRWLWLRRHCASRKLPSEDAEGSASPCDASLQIL